MTHTTNETMRKLIKTGSKDRISICFTVALDLRPTYESPISICTVSSLPSFEYFCSYKHFQKIFSQLEVDTEMYDYVKMYCIVFQDMERGSIFDIRPYIKWRNCQIDSNMGRAL